MTSPSRKDPDLPLLCEVDETRPIPSMETADQYCHDDKDDEDVRDILWDLLRSEEGMETEEVDAILHQRLNRGFAHGSSLFRSKYGKRVYNWVVGDSFGEPPADEKDTSWRQTVSFSVV